MSLYHFRFWAIKRAESDYILSNERLFVHALGSGPYLDKGGWQWGFELVLMCTPATPRLVL